MGFVRLMYVLICMEEDLLFLREVFKFCREFRLYVFVFVILFGILDVFLGLIVFNWIEVNVWF